MRSLGLEPRESIALLCGIVWEASDADCHLEIKILGFQSSDLLQIDENIKHSYFLYPDEDVSVVS